MNTAPLTRLIADLSRELELDLRGLGVPGLLSSYASGPGDWNRFALFDSQTYARNLVHESELFELIVICWNANQKSPIHNHQNQRCWMGVLEGRIDEVLFRLDSSGRGPLQTLGSRQFAQSQVAFISDDIALHQIASAGGRAVSLHLYSKPIRTCQIYDPENGQVSERRLAYHSIDGELVSVGPRDSALRS